MIMSSRHTSVNINVKKVATHLEKALPHHDNWIAIPLVVMSCWGFSHGVHSSLIHEKCVQLNIGDLEPCLTHK